MMRKSWDAIAKSKQLQILIDPIHLNDKTAAIIAELTGSFLTDH
jgi:hypothetical protein